MTTTATARRRSGARSVPTSGLVRLVVSWILATLALLVAAWIVPGASVESFGGAFVAAAVIAILNALLPPVIAALRLPLMLVTGLLLVLILDALMLLAADNITDGDLSIDSFWSALGVALVASAVSVVLDVVFGTNDDDAYTLRVIQRIAKRSGERVETDAAGDHLPRDRRPRAARPAARDAGRERAEHGALARRGRLHADGVGDRPLLADGRLAGGDPARLERGHPRVPLGREGDGDDDDLLGAARLRRDRAPPCGSRAAPRRRREPRQPALGRGRPLHPHGEPDGGGEEGEPRLPGLPRQRLQRHPRLRPPLLGGRARALGLEPRQAARRAAAGAPGRLSTR